MACKAFDNSKKHLEICELCRNDLAEMDAILDDFEDMELVQAPEKFTLEVMNKIATLNLYASEKISVPIRVKILDGAIFAAGIAIFMLVFSGAALALFGTEIFAWLNNLGLYNITTALTPFANAASNVGVATTNFWQNLGEWSNETIVFSSIAFLSVFVVLVILQVKIFHKESGIKNY